MATGDSGASTRATRASTRGSVSGTSRSNTSAYLTQAPKKKSTKATSDGVVEPADSVEARVF